MSMHKVHLTLTSSNKKTGPIPVSTSTKEFCPNTCPLKDSGCYASGGPLAIHWGQVTAGKRGMSWGDFCDAIKGLPRGKLWRHNQAGDLPTGDGVTIDRDAMGQLIRANKGKRGFTYTHHVPSVENLQAVRDANNGGFTVNLSGNSLDHADQLKKVAPDLPVVAVVPANMDGNLPRRSAGGHALIQCPATTAAGEKRGVTCETCQLCQVGSRRGVVCFPAHGTSKKKASAIAES